MSMLRKVPVLGIGILFFVLNIHQAKAEDWCFITLADWHGAEGYVLNPEKENSPGALEQIETLKYINQNYGGELVMLPGDSNSAKWWRPSYPEHFDTTPEDAVLQAGRNSYGTMQTVFEEAGYSTLLMAIGDHELGGNAWPANHIKTRLVPEFREAFKLGFNADPETGEFLFPDTIGDVESRPHGIYSGTSFAYRHKNVLFVTVDAFKLVEPLNENFWDRNQGLGGEGTVTCTLEGDHLEWFEKVLIEARKDSTIKHILVQAHLPILQPVRKVNCSGQFLDHAEKSEFWKMMRKYNVDIYFAGEVHSNTASKDRESNLIQIVSRGNKFNNFLKVCVTDETIDITSYNEVGVKPKNNRNYEYYGHLNVDKSNGSTKFDSSGSLLFFNRWVAVIYFDFEEKVSLASRPVPVLKHDDYENTLIQRKITVRGTECAESFPNRGSYDRLYDAQVGNVTLVSGVRGKAAKFNWKSRVAVWGMGPHSGGHKVSYALYFKTIKEGDDMVLVHYGSAFGSQSMKSIFTLALKKGIPVLYSSSNQLLVASDNLNLANGNWQHIAVSMPRKSCFLSEVRMYVNGEKIKTHVDGDNVKLFFHTTGRVSLGGFGHSNSSYDSYLKGLQPFQGLMDEFFLWAREMFPVDLERAMKKDKQFEANYGRRCAGARPYEFLRGVYFRVCNNACIKDESCLGYDYTWKDGRLCRLFKDRPTVGRKWDGSQCKIASIM